jgi:hypothetical protein
MFCKIYEHCGLKRLLLIFCVSRATRFPTLAQCRVGSGGAGCVFAPPIVAHQAAVAAPQLHPALHASLGKKRTVSCLLLGSDVARSALLDTLFRSSSGSGSKTTAASDAPNAASSAFSMGAEHAGHPSMSGSMSASAAATASAAASSASASASSSAAPWVVNGQCALPWSMHAAGLPADAHADHDFARSRFVKIYAPPAAPAGLEQASLAALTAAAEQPSGGGKGSKSGSHGGSGNGGGSNPALERVASVLPFVDSICILLGDDECCDDDDDEQEEHNSNRYGNGKDSARDSARDSGREFRGEGARAAARIAALARALQQQQQFHTSSSSSSSSSASGAFSAAALKYVPVEVPIVFVRVRTRRLPPPPPANPAFDSVVPQSSLSSSASSSSALASASASSSLSSALSSSAPVSVALPADQSWFAYARSWLPRFGNKESAAAAASAAKSSVLSARQVIMHCLISKFPVLVPSPFFLVTHICVWIHRIWVQTQAVLNAFELEADEVAFGAAAKDARGALIDAQRVLGAVAATVQRPYVPALVFRCPTAICLPVS